jgi:hypothetical protein
MAFQGCCWRDLELQSSLGGRHGGSETPDLWRFLLDVVLRRVVSRWHSEGLGIVFEGASLGSDAEAAATDRLTTAVWADDVVLFARNLQEAHRMAEVPGEVLAEWGLKVKEGSIEVLSHSEGSLSWTLGGLA